MDHQHRYHQHERYPQRLEVQRIAGEVAGAAGRVSDTRLFAVTVHAHHAVRLRADARAFVWEAVDEAGAVIDRFERTPGGAEE